MLRAANAINPSSSTAKPFSMRIPAALHRQLKRYAKQEYTNMEFALEHLPGSLRSTPSCTRHSGGIQAPSCHSSGCARIVAPMRCAADVALMRGVDGPEHRLPPPNTG